MAAARDALALRASTGVVALLVLGGLGTAHAQAPALAAFSTGADGAPAAPWAVVTLPKLPRHTRYAVVTLDGERVLRVEADASYANLLHPLSADLRATPLLRWRWRVARFPDGADLRRKDADDVAARLCVLFDLPLERLSAGERLKVRLGRTLFDPALPAAAICYVWDRDLPAGTWLPSAYTGRVQMMVLRSAASGDGRDAWRAETRDLAADFARAFPQEAASGPTPPLLAIGVSGDADNTGGRALAFFGDLSLAAPSR